MLDTHAPAPSATTSRPAACRPSRSAARSSTRIEPSTRAQRLQPSSPPIARSRAPADIDRRARSGGAARAARRRARRAQGQPLRARHADDRLVADPRPLRPALRRHGRAAARGGRRRHRRQDQLRRVRDGIVERELRVRPRAQSVGDRSHAGRLERRLGRGGRRALRAARARLRHRRIDPAAGVVLRRRRPEADLRARLALRPARLRVVARSDRPARPHGRRRGAGAVGPRRRGSRAMPPRRSSRCPTSRPR